MHFLALDNPQKSFYFRSSCMDLSGISICLSFSQSKINFYLRFMYTKFFSQISVQPLFRSLVDRDPWEAVLKGKGVQESWTLFKEEVLKAQELAIPLCWKTSQRGRSPVWLNSKLWVELGGKKEGLWTLDEGAGHSGGLQGYHGVMQGEN